MSSNVKIHCMMNARRRERFFPRERDLEAVVHRLFGRTIGQLTEIKPKSVATVLISDQADKQSGFTIAISCRPRVGWPLCDGYLFAQYQVPVNPICYLELSNIFLSRHLQGCGLARTLLLSLLDYAESNSYQSFRLTAENLGSYAWVKAGFLPTEASWLTVSKLVMDRISYLREILPLQAHEEIMEILDKKGPEGIRDLASFPVVLGVDQTKKHLRAKGESRGITKEFEHILRGQVVAHLKQYNTELREQTPLGVFLLTSNCWQGTLNLEDAESRAVFTKYLRAVPTIRQDVPTQQPSNARDRGWRAALSEIIMTASDRHNKSHN